MQIGAQLIPAYEPLLASMPSGREYHTPKVFKIPTLDEDEVAKMRAPLDLNELSLEGGEDDSDEGETPGTGEPVGAFPGTKSNYPGSSGTGYF